MSEGILRLKEVGAQKIYEATHISRKNIEAIFDRSYKGMSKVQLFGFLTIIEREYKVDLTSVRQDYLSQHGAPDDKMEEQPSLTVEPKARSKSGSKLIVIALLILVAVWFTFTGDRGDDATQPVEEQKTEEVIVVQEVISQELNATDENVTAAEEVASIPVEPVLPERFLIEPKSKLWMGFIDLETLERSQKMTSNRVELDAKKGWLLVFGHGYFKIHIDENLHDYSEKRKLRMIYENGELRMIDTAEFKARNRGDNW